jgi:hypothetical protein
MGLSESSAVRLASIAGAGFADGFVRGINDFRLNLPLQIPHHITIKKIPNCPT